MLDYWKTICNLAAEMSKNLYIIREIYDNSKYPAVQIATGGKNEKTEIIVETTYNKIAEYVK